MFLVRGNPTKLLLSLLFEEEEREKRTGSLATEPEPVKRRKPPNTTDPLYVKEKRKGEEELKEVEKDVAVLPTEQEGAEMIERKGAITPKRARKKERK
jgi:hypothetical protein